MHASILFLIFSSASALKPRQSSDLQQVNPFPETLTQFSVNRLKLANQLHPCVTASQTDFGKTVSSHCRRRKRWVTPLKLTIEKACYCETDYSDVLDQCAADGCYSQTLLNGYIGISCASNISQTACVETESCGTLGTKCNGYFNSVLSAAPKPVDASQMACVCSMETSSQIDEWYSKYEITNLVVRLLDVQTQMYGQVYNMTRVNNIGVQRVHHVKPWTQCVQDSSQKLLMAAFQTTMSPLQTKNSACVETKRRQLSALVLKLVIRQNGSARIWILFVIGHLLRCQQVLPGNPSWVSPFSLLH